MGGLAQFLCDGGYERLRRATRTHRGDLIVRLCGEVGLRPKDVVTISSNDAIEIDGVWFLDVGVRKAYLPADVAHAIRKYARSIDTEEALVDVSERRIQMLVRECGNRAADATGDDRFREISTRDLRAFHACQLVADGVNLSVVLAVTAYNRLAALEPYIDPPDQERIASTLDSKQSTVDPPSTRFRRAVTVAADVGKELTAAVLRPISTKLSVIGLLMRTNTALRGSKKRPAMALLLEHTLVWSGMLSNGSAPNPKRS
ncbi:hypothetical protein ACFQJ8_20645 [Halocatena marina]|uniref:hypothetical protein n=1 Tax=Halocatena marina TaxID=2934937 RepID=UPI00360D6CAE